MNYCEGFLSEQPSPAVAPRGSVHRATTPMSSFKKVYDLREDTGSDVGHQAPRASRSHKVRMPRNRFSCVVGRGRERPARTTYCKRTHRRSLRSESGVRSRRGRTGDPLVTSWGKTIPRERLTACNIHPPARKRLQLGPDESTQRLIRELS